jgi:hypothetical protein
MNVLQSSNQTTEKSISFDMKRMKQALSSGAPIKLPKNLSREEKRKFIIANR